MKSKAYYKKKWWITGGLGAVAFGTGLSCTIEVAFLKHEGAPTLQWLGLGTLSLALLIIGLNYIVDAVRYKIKWKEKG